MPVKNFTHNNKLVYKSILSGNLQSLEETIFESLSYTGFVSLFIIAFVGFMYGGIVIKEMKCDIDIRINDPECNTNIIKITRSILFWSFVSMLSSIFSFVIFIINIMISMCLMPNKHILSSAIIYGFPLGYFIAYNLVLFFYNNM